jgi:hypothetical protein
VVSYQILLWSFNFSIWIVVVYSMTIFVHFMGEARPAKSDHSIILAFRFWQFKSLKPLTKKPDSGENKQSDWEE